MCMCAELGEMVLEKIKGQDWGYGFNAKTLEFTDLIAAGVTDPASVNTWALENSASIAGSLLTTEALICQNERPQDEEEYVPEFLPSVVGVQYLQVGANCGKNTAHCGRGGDPVWNYVTACGWRGFSIEPVRQHFEDLCTNMKPFPRVTPLHAAISDQAGEAWVGLRGEMSQMLSSPSSHAKELRVERVAALTLRDVWRAGGRAGPDVLVVDAEGAEARILGGNDSFPEPPPSLVLFEHAHLSAKEQGRVSANLQRQGFRHLADLRHHDHSAERHRLPPQDRLFGRPRRRS